MTTGRVGTIGTIHKVDKAWITDNTLIIEINDENKVNIDYLYHVLSLVDFKSIITGNAQPLITATRLKEIEVSVPDMNTQKHISSVFDRFDSMMRYQENLISIVTRERERERESLQRKLLG